MKANPIEEYLDKKEDRIGSELFKIDEDNSDIKTELTDNEIVLINVLKANDDFLEEKKLKPLYSTFYKNLMRLKVSKERQGRKEYVDLYRKDNSEETINKFGNLSNIMSGRK